MNCDITLREYIIPLLGLLYIISGILYPLFNGLLTGVRNDGDGKNDDDFIRSKFPYPFTLIFIEAFVGSLIFSQ